MAKKNYVWEVHLRPNTLTKDNDRDCIADVYAHEATQRNALITNYQLKIHYQLKTTYDKELKYDKV